MSISLSAFGSDLGQDKLLTLARIAETAERYEDMTVFMAELVKKKCDASQELSVEERNLLSVAYKNVVGAKRASWRTLSSENEGSELRTKYKTYVEDELKVKCDEVLSLLKDNLLKKVKEAESEPNKKEGFYETQVFYLKMCGDYYRYLAEFKPDGGFAKDAEQMYSEALEAAEKNLEETHPTRLGLALNFSVCYYEILKDPEKACNLAKKAFDDAIQKLDTLSDASYKDSTLIMQLLRDNLTLWTSEAVEQEDKAE